jgi:hypothetical protein
MPAQPGRNHPGIVYDEAIASPQKIAQPGEDAMRHLSSPSLQNQQTGLVPWLDRILGNEPCGKVIIKIFNPHYFR